MWELCNFKSRLHVVGVDTSVLLAGVLATSVFCLYVIRMNVAGEKMELLHRSQQLEGREVNTHQLWLCISFAPLITLCSTDDKVPIATFQQETSLLILMSWPYSSVTQLSSLWVWSISLVRQIAFDLLALKKSMRVTSNCMSAYRKLYYFHMQASHGSQL